ncbi:hypothetical protein [Pseudomonas sp. AMR01]
MNSVISFSKNSSCKKGGRFI